MRITSSGNVGIGTTSPAVPLHVDGFARFNGGLQLDGNNRTIYAIDNTDLLLGTNNAEKVRIKADGNVGIGVTTPLDVLHVDGTIRAISPASTDWGLLAQNNAGVASSGIWFDNGDGELLLRDDENNLNIRLRSDADSYINGGNVGIGTTSPGLKLDVIAGDNNGIRISSQAPSTSWKDIKILSYVSESQAASFSDGSHIYTTSPSGATTWPFTEYGALVIEGRDNNNGGIALRTGTGTGLATRVAIREGGNVGIGTTNPNAKLEVNGNIAINAGQKIQLSGAADSTHHIYHDASTDYDKINYSSGFQLEHLTNGIQMALVGSSGRVGIGTTSPSEKLEVAGNTILDASNANLKIKAGTTGTKGDIQWTFNTDSTVYASVGIDYDNRTTDGFLIDSGYPITLDYASSYIRFSNNGSEKMRIDTSGNVGIGTTNPSEELHMVSTSPGIRLQDSDGTNTHGRVTYSGTSLYFLSRNNTSNGNFIFVGSSGTADTEFMRINNSGNVGIGTTNPSAKLDINQTAVNGGIIIRSSVTQPEISFVDDSTGDSFSIGHNRAANRMDIEINGTDVHTFTEGGNVGIGTISPSRRLEVSSSGVIADFNSSTTSSYIDIAGTTAQLRAGVFGGVVGIANGTGTSAHLALSSGGNVGIGTTNPTSDLHISDSFPRITLQDSDGTNTLSYIDQDGSYLNLIARNGTNHGSIRFRRYNGTTTENSMIIDHFGKVGIGTTSPSAKVHASDGGTIPSLDAGTMFLASNTSGTGDYSSMSIMSGTAGIASLFFGDTDAEKRGAVRYLNSSEALRFRTANTDRLSIKSNGFVGINTTDPLARLHVVGSEGIAIANGSNTKTTLIPSGGGNSELTLKGQNYVHYVNYETSWNSFRYARFKSSYNTSDSELYLYKSDGSGGTAATTTISTGTSKFAGSIGVNTTSVRSTLDVNGPLSVVGGTFTSGASGADSNGNSGIVVRRGKRILSGIPNGAQEDFLLRNLIWQTTGNNIEIGQLGTSLIGDISLQAGSSGNIKFFGSGSEDMRVNSSGNVCIGNTNNTYALDVTGTIRATGDVIAYSDIRVKENIKTIDNALDKVKALRGVEYNKIDSSEKSIGVIAQEIEEIIPQVVKEDEVGMKSVAYGNITAVLIEAIKEQQKQIDQLKAIIDGST